MDKQKDSVEQDQIAPEKKEEQPPKKRGCCGPKLNIDWNAVRDDMLKPPGMPLKLAAEKWGVKANTLAAVASRRGWRIPNAKIRASVAILTQAAASPILDVARAEADLFVRETLELVRSGREKLAKHGNKPLNLSKLAVFADALDKLDKVGRRSLGLDAQQGNYNVGLAVSVNVNSENDGGNGVQTGPGSTEKAQVIDV